MRLPTRFFHSLLTSVVWWLGMAVSLVLALLVNGMVEDKSAAQFEYQVNNAQLAIQERVRSYIDVLRGASAVFYSSENITREEFRAYVKHLQLERGFPGVTNLNVALRVTASEKQRYEASVRADTSIDPAGYPGFAIKPAGERDEYHVLTYLEPLESNMLSFGLDIATREGVADTLAASRDSGQVHSSGRLIHISGPHRHVGLAMRMPLYRRGMPLSSVEERRAAYFGSVGAGFEINKLMRGAIDKAALSQLHVKIYDTGLSGEQRYAGTRDPGHLLYDSETAQGASMKNEALLLGGGMLSRRVSMAIGPRVWEAEFSVPKAVMAGGINAWLPHIVLTIGLLGSTLLFSIIYSLTSARRRAVELAKEMTKDLRASEASLAEAQHMAHLGSWLLDPATLHMSWSAETFRIFGTERFAYEPEFADFLARVHDDDRQQVRQGLETAIGSGEEFNTEHRITQRDGAVRWVRSIARLSSSNGRVLLRGTLMDITEPKETVEALQRSQELLRELSAHQYRVKEDERRRIAREIHDELGQTLLALRIDVSMLEARTGISHPRLNEKVRDALRHIDSTVKTIRTIINNLRPSVLDLGLVAALEWQVSEFRRRSTVECELRMDEEEFAIGDARATTLFRILQESLTNVLRHAQASHVLIDLFRDGTYLVMQISDNGVGIEPGSIRSGQSFGLVGMEERLHALDGELVIDSVPGQGTTLTIFIPLEKEREEPARLAAN